ncbi:MAG: hypothetical protein EXR94_12620 [Gemmatimonadetes bacterium]|nr:hypothetical protein [Gemmatimonadota bacterium]
MSNISIRSSRWIGAAAIAALTLAAGCSSEPEEMEPEVETMRVTIGTTVINFSGGTCTPVPASATIPAGGAAVSATFLKADGSPETIVTDQEFELKVEPAGRFTRASAFAGTLSGGAAGTTAVTFALFHKIEQHEDFGPCSLPITVQ